MTVTIRTNINSLAAQRQLSESSDLLAKTQERLSSGQRINRASDDAAGLAIASSLRLDTRVFTAAIRNVNDGLSSLSIAEGALTQLSAITTRQAELAEQAANGVYSYKQRSALSAEANALADEFNRIVQTTKFNSVDLLGNGNTQTRIQSGFGVDGSILLAIGNQLAQTTGDGTVGTAVGYVNTNATQHDVVTGDFNGDSKLDFVTTGSGRVSLFLGNGDGTFAASTSVTLGAGNKFSIQATDLNNDQKTDLVVANSAGTTFSILLGTGSGTFTTTTATSGVTGLYRSYTADINNDGKVDVVSIGSGSGTSFGVALGNGDGTFRTATSFAAATASDTATLGDFNNDGKIDIAQGSFGNGNVYVYFGNGDGSFRTGSALATGGASAGRSWSGDLNLDGIADIVSNDSSGKTYVLISNGDGTFKASASYATASPISSTFVDINGDGYKDIASTYGGGSGMSILLNRGDGTFSAAISYAATASTSNGIANGDFNGDGAADFVVTNVGSVSTSVFLGNTTQRTTIAKLDLFSQASARSALDIITATRTRIGKELGAIGSYQSRLQSTLNTVHSAKLNEQTAESRITDADVATEAAQQVRLTIRQKASAAVLAQANLLPSLALTLLKL